MDAVESGELSESQIDEKVLRILTPMFALGLFDGALPFGNLTNDVTRYSFFKIAPPSLP